MLKVHAPDKFNVIKNDIDNTRNYNSLIKNYIENYIESDINIIHPDRVHQLIWSNKFSPMEITSIIENLLNNFICQKRQNIRSLIKNDSYDLSCITNFISKYYIKINKLVNLLNLNRHVENLYSLFLEKLLFDPVVINYLEGELANLDKDTVNEVKKLLELIKTMLPEKDTYLWFIKLLGSSLRNNIVSINVNIPFYYKILYELKNIIEYLNNITNIYSFMDNSLHLLLNPICEILHEKCLLLVTLSKPDGLTMIIKNLNINKIFNTDELKKKIILSLSTYINKFFIDIDSLSYEDTYDIINLIICCNKNNLLDSYLLLVFDNMHFINLTLDIIDNNIYKNKHMVYNIINLLKSLKNKEIFVDKYHKLLIRRLLSNQVELKSEKYILISLKLIFQPKLTIKIEKVITDFESSQDNIKNFNKLVNLNNTIQIITTSYSNWDINYTQGYYSDNVDSIDIFLPNDLSSIMRTYQWFYSKRFNNSRKLLWLFHYGEVDITYNNINIKLLPIQLLVLQKIENARLTHDELMNQPFFINYSNSFKSSIIDSLFTGKIIKHNDKIIELSNNTCISENLIELINNDTIKITNIDIYEPVFSREDILKSIINHHVKVSPKANDELYKLVEADLTIFKLNDILFKSAIESMIKEDYIIVENNNYTRCLY